MALPTQVRILPPPLIAADAIAAASADGGLASGVLSDEDLSVDLPSARRESNRVKPDEPVRRQFADNLRHHRERRNMSQEALAAICGLHRTEISLLERCQRSPRLETIVILARGLELRSAGELLKDMG